tara:strand:- start:1341 stop:1811 length:471 start_codon:yes stop_codon:yes gene_type:complete
MQLDHIIEFLKKPIEDLEYVLVEVNILGSKNPTLQIMIERKDRNNISLKDCENVSRTLSTLIDVEDVISGQYTLEISSPGVERKLNNLQDYERFTGKDALVQLRVPINDIKRIRCNIQSVTKDNRIEFLCLDGINSDDHIINISLQDIETAKLLAP